MERICHVERVRAEEMQERRCRGVLFCLGDGAEEMSRSRSLVWFGLQLSRAKEI